MTNVVQLDDQSFYLDASSGGAKSTLKLRMGGAVLVMFTLPKCRGCNTFKPKFFEIAATQPSINFALCDLAAVKNLVGKSRASTTPLQSVPTVILYAEGAPRAKFKGTMNIPSVESFIAKGIRAITSNQTAYRGHLPQPTHSRVAPQHQQISPSQPNRLPQSPMATSQKFSSVAQETYASLGNPEEDDDTCLLMPNGICPYNQPWSSEFKTL